MSERRFPASNVPASRVRYGVLAFACTLSMVTYLDRVAVASAAGDIVSALGLKSVTDIKWAFTAFALAYALFEVPTGWMGDTFGPRKSLLRIVLWWSVFESVVLVAMSVWQVVYLRTFFEVKRIV